jgi:site-specific DNA-methyltransferase (adenine-specific)
VPLSKNGGTDTDEARKRIRRCFYRGDDRQDLWVPLEKMTYEIRQGDCLEVLQTLPSASVDVILTDPPYAIPTIVASGRDNTRNVGDLSLIESVFRQLFGEFSRLLKPSGRIFMFCDGNSYPVIFRAAFGEYSTALLVWAKGRAGMGREFRKSHELILHCWRSETPVFSDGKQRLDVLECKPLGNDREHPAQKPIELLSQLLEISSGGLVLDPFMGSGSSGVAALKCGHRFVGIEIEPKYCELAEKRLEHSISSQVLFV